MTSLKRCAAALALCLIAMTGAAAPVDGYWLGTLAVDSGHKLRLQLNVWSDPTGIRCKMDSLDQNAFGIECANAKAEGQRFSFDIPAVAGRYIGSLSEDGKRLSGTWSQGQSWPLVMDRQEKLQEPPPRKPPEFEPAMPPVSAADMQAVLTKDFAQSLKSGPLAKGTGIGVAIGVLRDGEQRIFTFGAAKPDSVFEIGSITKTFTGLMLAQMIEQRQVTADQPVRSLLPDVVPKPDGTEITLLDLVTQHSGLPRMPSNFPLHKTVNPYVDYTAENLYAYLAQQGLAKPADAQPLYSNLGFGLLGQALENRAGVDYSVLLSQLVTAPLCMTDTVIQLDESRQRRFIQGHTNNRERTGPWEFDAFAGAGAIRSSAADLLKYLSAQMKSEPCESARDLAPSKTLVAALKRSQTVQADMWPNMKIAYAWLVNTQTGSYWHNGGTGGYSSFSLFNPQRGYAVVVLSNLALGPKGSLADFMGDHIERRLSGQQVIKREE